MSVKFCSVLCCKCTWYLGIPLPHEGGFSKVKNAYINSAYYSIRDDYGVNPEEIWMYGDWFYTTGYGIFANEVKVTRRPPPYNLIRWIMTQAKGKQVRDGLRLFSPYFQSSRQSSLV